MNLELIKKLIKLANNNPNENEANLAARKACKLIGDNDLGFLNGSKSVKPPTAPYSPPNTRKTAWDVMNEYKRKNTYSYREWEEPYIRWDGEPSKRTENRKLRCKTCGLEKDTKFVGAPEVFECNSCQWTAYQRSKNEQNP